VTRDTGYRLEAMPSGHLEDLRAEAQHARQRYDLYKAKSYGMRPTSAARMRELERASEQAEARLRTAEAKERHARPTADGPPS
jgi:sRNA-binding protein